MTLDCLDNLIGIDGTCNDVDSTSGLNITDLPNISLNIADKGISENFLSGKQLIEKKIQFAKNTVLNRIRAYLLPKVRINSNLENDTIGHYTDNLKIETLEANKYKGIEVTIDSNPNLEFYINSISFQTKTAITTNILIFDLITGNQLDAFPITTTVNNITTIQVNKGYKSNKQRLHIIVVVDSGLSDVYQTSIHRNFLSTCSTCTQFWNNSYIRFNGIEIPQASQKISSNLKGINGTNGLSINYSLNCSLDAYICNIGNLLAWPVLHKAGAEIMRELIYSKRLNTIVTVFNKDNEALREEFEGEFEASIKEVMENIVVPNDICFSCNPRTQWKTDIL